MKLETIESNGAKVERIASAAFQSMVLDKSDACNDVITLRLRNARDIVHEILDPIRITLHPSGDADGFNPLQIVAENGTAILTLHPAIHAQMLEDIKTN